MDLVNWAETYRFMDDRNPAYVTTNISNATLKQVNVNALLIVDRDGQVVLGRDVDLTNEEALGLEFTRLKALPDHFPWRANSLAGTVWGLLPTEQGILLLGAAPVLD